MTRKSQRERKKLHRQGLHICLFVDTFQRQWHWTLSPGDHSPPHSTALHAFWATRQRDNLAKIKSKLFKGGPPYFFFRKKSSFHHSDERATWAMFKLEQGWIYDNLISLLKRDPLDPDNNISFLLPIADVVHSFLDDSQHDPSPRVRAGLQEQVG